MKKDSESRQAFGASIKEGLEKDSERFLLSSRDSQDRRKRLRLI